MTSITHIGLGSLKKKSAQTPAPRTLCKSRLKECNYQMSPARISKEHAWHLGEPTGEGYWYVEIQGAFHLQGVSDGYSIECASVLTTVKNKVMLADWVVELPWECQLERFRALVNRVRWTDGRIYLEKWHGQVKEEDWEVYSQAEYDPRVEGLCVALPPLGLPLLCLGIDKRLVVVADGWGARAPIGGERT